VYGRARPATGFATDLKALMALLPADAGAQRGAISMPDADDPTLDTKARELRAAGEVVINCLSSNPDPRCDREIVEQNGDWIVRPLTD
jgi:ATP phosphoribosyltransferase regulatory subunit